VVLFSFKLQTLVTEGKKFIHCAGYSFRCIFSSIVINNNNTKKCSRSNQKEPWIYLLGIASG